MSPNGGTKSLMPLNFIAIFSTGYVNYLGRYPHLEFFDELKFSDFWKFWIWSGLILIVYILQDFLLCYVNFFDVIDRCEIFH